MNLEDYLRDVPDFPKPGIVFKDISPLLASPEAFETCIAEMAEAVADLEVDRVIGIESRGFLFGTPLAMRLGVGFTPIRKPGKLPADTVSVEYELEYGTDKIEIHTDALTKGQKVLVLDDVLATGGTAVAACDLVEKVGGQVAACLFVLELGFLKGRERLSKHSVRSLINLS